MLNSYPPCHHELGGPNAFFFEADHKTPGRQDGQTGDFQRVDYLPSREKYFDHLAEKIIPLIPSRKHLWSFSFEWIWRNQLKPLLEDAYKLAHDVPLDEVVRAREPEKKNIMELYNLDQLRRMGIEVIVQEGGKQDVSGS
jgi:hypothetical protein